MRIYAWLLTCTLLTGCGRQDQNHREVLGKLEAIKAEVASHQAAPVRWAFANKDEIATAIAHWSQSKIDEAKRSETLPSDVEEKIAHYEALQGELNHLRIFSFRLRMPVPPLYPGTPAPTPPPEQTAAEKEITVLSKKVEEAKAPIASIVDHREHQAAQFHNQYSVDQLIAEYVKGRYDLVLNDGGYGHYKDAVLYRTSGEVSDITEGIISLFKEKTKQ